MRTNSTHPLQNGTLSIRFLYMVPPLFYHFTDIRWSECTRIAQIEGILPNSEVAGFGLARYPIHPSFEVIGNGYWRLPIMIARSESTGRTWTPKSSSEPINIQYPAWMAWLRTHRQRFPLPIAERSGIYVRQA